MLEALLHPENRIRQWVDRHRTALLVAGFVALFGLGYLARWAIYGRKVRQGVSQGPLTRQAHPGVVHDAAGPKAGRRLLTVTPEAQALMNVSVAPVMRRYASVRVEMDGEVEHDHSRLTYVKSRVSGRIERLYLSRLGTAVREGQLLAVVYSEELYVAQKAFLEAMKNRGDSDNKDRLAVESARRDLRRMGMSRGQIAGLSRMRAASPYATVRASTDGVLASTRYSEGDIVQAGERFCTIGDLDAVWVELHARMEVLPWLRYGQEVELVTEEHPGRSFFGRVIDQASLPDPETRTVPVHIRVPNPRHQLRPRMRVHAVAEVRPTRDGRVFDAELAGKWIAPHHPGIVRDNPGKCEICGRQLVSTDSLGYVSPSEIDSAKPFLVPASAVLQLEGQGFVYIRWAEFPAT